MLKFAPQITIYNLPKEITTQHEVIWLFSKQLHNISSVRHRLNIYIVNSDEQERVDLNGSIKSIWKYFDCSSLSHRGEKEQKNEILLLLKSCFLQISEPLKWDKGKIQSAYEGCVKENVDFTYQTKSKLNKSRTQLGYFNLTIEKDKVMISGTIEDKKTGKINTISLIETNEYNVSAFRAFNSFKWFTNSDFGFEFRNGVVLKFNVNSKEPKWEFKSLEKERKDHFLHLIHYSPKTDYTS